jgi:hypothetical protein
MQQWALHQTLNHGNGLVKPPKPELYSGGPSLDLWNFGLQVYFIAVNMVQDAQRIAFEEEHINASYTDGQQSQDRTKQTAKHSEFPLLQPYCGMQPWIGGVTLCCTMFLLLGMSSLGP